MVLLNLLRTFAKMPAEGRSKQQKVHVGVGTLGG